MPVLDLREPASAEARGLPDLVPGQLRTGAIATWTGRMVNEHGSAQVFEHLARQLRAAGVADDQVRACASFADEERRHGVLCGAVVEALGGEARSEVEPPPLFPEHDDTDPLEAAVRNLVSISCLHETVAVALIGAEREDMPEGPLRELLTRIWADECGHANFGWRLLPELLGRLDATGRERLGRYLFDALRFLEDHELRHLPLASQPPPEGARLGMCSGADARALFYATVEEVIVPGLEAHGLPARSAWQQARRPSTVG